MSSWGNQPPTSVICISGRFPRTLFAFLGGLFFILFSFFRAKSKEASLCGGLRGMLRRPLGVADHLLWSWGAEVLWTRGSAWGALAAAPCASRPST